MDECIILAGGFGTRLQSVVKDLPKCMAEVAGKPFLYYLFGYLEQQKVAHVILSLGYKSEVVINWLNKHTFLFKLSYVVEKEPLGTGGAIKLAMSKAESNRAFVINGDTFFDVDLQSMKGLHQEKNAGISIALKPMQDFDRYGSVELDDENRIITFNEKKYRQAGLINGGVYLINKAVFANAGLPDKFSFEKDMLENKSFNAGIFGYVQSGYFIDIGIPSDFEKANVDFTQSAK
ncbi:nucleotidyltransferase family protein [Viscerimonas tarda]